VKIAFSIKNRIESWLPIETQIFSWLLSPTALFIWLSVYPLSVEALDLDHDGIPDQFELYLAMQYRPIVLLDRAGAYEPVNVAQVLPRACLESASKAGVFALKDASFAELAEFLRQDHQTKGLKLYPVKLNWRAYRPQPGTLPTLFWRVSRLTTNSLSLQYYWFSTFNDASLVFGAGDHEGDWMAIDLTVALEGSNHRIESVIFHNHGRQLLPDLGQCKWQGDRIIVYSEYQTNEPWPVPAKGPVKSIPTNKDYGSAIVRSHLGAGKSISEWALVALGERAFPESSPEAMVVMRFEGLWGRTAGLGADLSYGPAQQRRIWDREFSKIQRNK